MRRRVFEADLSQALADADGVVLGSVNRADQLADAERLSPDRVVANLRAAGRPAQTLPSADAIAEYLGEESNDGDVILVLSNGSFDGLHDKLLARLAAKTTAPRGVR